jgi:hypothetical protein
MGYRRDLTVEQNEEVVSLVNEFDLMLQSSGRALYRASLNKLAVSAAVPERWVLAVETNRVVALNPYLAKHCSFGYFKFLVLREIYRLRAQGIADSATMRTIKHSFGAGCAALMAAQADLFVTHFLLRKGLSLPEVLNLYREGCVVFASKDFNPYLFDRFIGSVITLVNSLIRNHESSECPEDELFHPSTQGLAYSTEMDVLVMQGARYTVKRMRVPPPDLADWRRCFSLDPKASDMEFVPVVAGLAARALGLKLPPSISRQIFGADPEEPAAG